MTGRPPETIPAPESGGAPDSSTSGGCSNQALGAGCLVSGLLGAAAVAILAWVTGATDSTDQTTTMLGAAVLAMASTVIGVTLMRRR